MYEDIYLVKYRDRGMQGMSRWTDRRKDVGWRDGGRRVEGPRDERTEKSPVDGSSERCKIQCYDPVSAGFNRYYKFRPGFDSTGMDSALRAKRELESVKILSVHVAEPPMKDVPHDFSLFFKFQQQGCLLFVVVCIFREDLERSQKQVLGYPILTITLYSIMMRQYCNRLMRQYCNRLMRQTVMMTQFYTLV